MIKLRKGKRALFWGKRKSVNKADEDCLNDNILTERVAEEQARDAHSPPKTKTKKLINPFWLFQKRSSSPSTVENSLVAPPEETAVEKAKEPKDVSSSGMFGVCGRAAAESIRPDPELSEPREDRPRDQRIENLQRQLHQLQGQVKNLHRELDYVHVEKEDAILKLDRMINKSKKRRKHTVDPYELEEIRLLLTADGEESTLTHPTVAQPFFTGLCYSCHEDEY